MITVETDCYFCGEHKMCYILNSNMAICYQCLEREKNREK